MSTSTPEKSTRLCGGIDLGGTKIESTLFDAGLVPVLTRRRPTPRDNYEALIAALAEEITHLRRTAGTPELAVGIGLPGLVDPQSGLSVTANLPANGKPLRDDLTARAGGMIVLANDCKCFALSEANGGAGDGYEAVFGLIMGTGLGGGMCLNGQLIDGPNQLAGEIGHSALPAHLVARHNLPILKCGCGRAGCYETLLSGPGLSVLCKTLSGETLTAPEVAARAAHDPAMERVMKFWAELAGELLHGIQLHLDPDCIVLGGGLSNINGIETLLAGSLKQSALPALHAPEILKPKFGDSSGGRGAALLARQIQESNS